MSKIIPDPNDSSTPPGAATKNSGDSNRGDLSAAKLPDVELIDFERQNFSRIETLLAPFIAEITEHIFNEVGAYVVDRCLNSGIEFEEIWIGVVDIGIRYGVMADVILCVDNFRYDEAREDFISELSIELAQKFPSMNYSDVKLGSSPYDQHPDSPVLERIKHPELWKQLYIKQKDTTLET